ncbi:unnamed protein product [Rotaria sordida]|uniref:Uncharacterized protein n=1 Tax=Rotaria sordida TaxID=392033 RepID=A0A818T3J0_9BILA|nr:unnamed protein product [Rotaria sordida]
MNSNSQRRIPRIIHQTWKDTNIPPRWNHSVQSVRKLNANKFEYRLWTDEDIYEFVREKEPDLYMNTFLAYSYDIQRVDAFRYILLYYVGGVYVDMDIGCSTSLDILLDALEALDPQAKHLAAFPATKPNGLSNDFMDHLSNQPAFVFLTKTSLNILLIECSDGRFGDTNDTPINSTDPNAKNKHYCWQRCTSGGSEIF